MPFKNIKSCKNNREIKCFISWNTSLQGTKPLFVDKKNLTCINPLTWKADNKSVELKKSKGSIAFKNYDANLTNSTPIIYELEGKVFCRNGHLIVAETNLIEFPHRLLNLHLYDYALFYGDIVKNSLERSKQFYKNYVQ